MNNEENKQLIEDAAKAQEIFGDDELEDFAARLRSVVPKHSDKYEVGAILESSWGYEQTNIDYYVIVSRSDSKKGTTTLTLLQLGKKNVKETGFMCGDCEPGEILKDAVPFRRKLAKHNGQERGLKIEHGWCDLWNGKPSHWSSYA